MNFPRRPDCRLTAWLFAAAVTAVAVGLHFYFLSRAGGLWRDEVHLVNLAALGSLSAMAHDSFPVLMPLLVKFWAFAGIGKTDSGLRLLGLLIGLGLPAALWLVAWKFRRSPPLPGLVLLALNGTAIVFGDSLRAHGLGALLILLAFAAGACFLEKPSRSRAIVWAGLSALSVQTLFHNAVFVAAICAGAWAVCARRKGGRAALKVLLVGLAAAVSLLPYLPTFFSLAAGAASLRTGVEPGRLRATVDDAFGFPLGQTVWLWLAFALAVLLSGLGSFLPRAKFPFPVAPLKFLPSARWTRLLIFLAAAAGFLWFAAAPAQRCWFFAALALAAVFLTEKIPCWRMRSKAICRCLPE